MRAPRFLAWSYSSSTSTLAPYLTTVARSALFSVFALFAHEPPGPLALHKTIAVNIPRPRSGFWVIIARGQSTHGGKATNTQWRHRRLGPTGNHDVSIAVLN